ncbi:MAG: RNA polymerase sigma factor [Deltaproteobacteria bacterium]|nr:RNA polymerase sigma factor [Deltaproteobacteria bacterium]MBK8236166.1 RNA polymerase sigma factor [Deltaproteobacteria bacterium]MBK8713772.1 RNA polymerase sigma factor [Deltaproteobacteria bacterium]MBP7290279.1 RNA polymerase sigma factor [Nannocystaceae bacterium]
MHALTARVAAGDRRAAEQLARISMPTVRAVACRLVANPADAADVGQGALVEVLRAAGNYRGEGPLLGWVARIAARSACHWLRSAQVRRAAATAGVGSEPIDDGADATRGEDALPRPLLTYLDALPEQQRTAFVLRHALEYTLPEIAELTGAPVPTVKSRILKALHELRRAMRRDAALGRVAPTEPDHRKDAS